jgi:hypothetical protein
MFLLTLHVQSQTGQEMLLRGQISCATQGAQPDFSVSVEMADGAWSRGVLVGHHRWCEPVRAFVARALAAVSLAADESKFSGSGVSLIKVSTLKLLVRDFRRGRRLVLEVDVPCVLEGEASKGELWALAAQQCVVNAFGQAECPPAPGPLRPKVYEAGADSDTGTGTGKAVVRYVRRSELPYEVAMATSWVLGRSSRVNDAPEPDAISVEAFEAFMLNEVDIPRPALGWLWP